MINNIENFPLNKIEILIVGTILYLVKPFTTNLTMCGRKNPIISVSGKSLAEGTYFMF
jgi:hypothetical protein